VKCTKCNQELPEEVKRIAVDGWEYDTKTTQLDVSFEDLKIPKGVELWTYEDCIKLHNNKKLRKQLDLDDCWFHIKQPFSFNEEKGLSARFWADSCGADLDCDWIPTCSDAALGVRFKRKIEK